MYALMRALIVALLIGGSVFWVPTAATIAATPFGDTSSVRGPALADNEDDDNNDDDDNNQDDDNAADDNGNENTASDDNDNGSDNDNDVSTSPSSDVPTDPSGIGSNVQNGDLTVELWRSDERPVVNRGFQIAVTGNGAPIERIWWWAEGPGAGGDDLAAIGVQSHDCGGAQPCAQNWSVVPRAVGFYHIHARVRDTSGREVQTDWYVLASENPRSG